MTEQYEYRVVAIDDIKPSPYNPRDITDPAFEGLKTSLKRFGLVDTVIINKRTGNLVGGHQRVKAAESVGITEIPAMVVDLSEVDEKALNVTLNNGLISGHFTDELKVVLADISESYSIEELQTLRLDELVVKTDWDTGAVDKVDENLDGITATIKIKCPQENAGDLKEWLISMLADSDYEGVKVV